MGDEQQPIIIPLELDMTEMMRDLSAIISQAGKAESAIDSLVATAQRASKALNDLSGGIDLSISVDTGDIDQAVTQINTLDGESVNVTVSADPATAIAEIATVDDVIPTVTVPVGADPQTAITEIATVDDVIPSVNVPVSADSASAISEIATVDDVIPAVAVPVSADADAAIAEIATVDDTVPAVDVSVSADTSAAQSAITTLDALLDPTDVVTVQGETTDIDGDLEEVKQKLDNLQKLSVINIGATLIGGAGDLFEKAKDLPIVGTINDATEAMREFTAATGDSGDVARDALTGAFEALPGADRSQITQTAIALTQAGVEAKDLKDAIVSTFTAAQATGADLNAVIDAQNQLVANKLVPTYTEGADLIVKGFQDGANNGGDFLQSLKQYAPIFADLGLNGSQALSIITQGMSQGASQAGKFGDVLKDFKKRIFDALETQSGTTFDTLQRLGLVDEAQAYKDGNLTGTQFVDAITQSVENSNQGDLDLLNIFGDPLKQLGTGILKGIDFGAADQAVIPQDVAKQAGDALNDSWGASLTELKRTVETELAESFRIAGVPLTEALDNAKDKVKELAELIQSGKSIPEALEIVLQAPGLTNQIERFEASVGDFIIDLQMALASALDIIPGNQGESALRSSIATQSKQQFSYDIKVANPDEVAGVVQKAISRGVDQADISDAFTQATGELISEGDVKRAQEMLYAVNQMADAYVTLDEGTPQEVKIPVYFDPDADQAAQQKAANDALTRYKEETGRVVLSWGDIPFSLAPTVDTTAAHKAIDDTLTQIDAGMQKLQMPAQLLSSPFTSILDALQSPGAQALGQQQYTAMALQKSKESTQGGVDWSDPNNAILPPVVVDDATKATMAISDATGEMVTTVTSNLQEVGNAADQNLGQGITTASKTASQQLDIITVSADDLSKTGVAKLQTFATIAIDLGNQVAAAWQGVQGAMAGATPPAPGTTPQRGRAGSDTQSTSDIPGYAKGGDVRADEPIVVGEEGKELFVPRANGMIIDSPTTALIMQVLGALKNGGGSSNSSTTINYNLGGLNNNFQVPTAGAGISASNAIARQIRSIR